MRESPSSDSQSYDDRQVIYLNDLDDDIEFVTFHNILYYMYTGVVNLHLQRIEDAGYDFPEGSPEEPDPFSLFLNADRFLLTGLKDVCFRHLVYGVTIENVAERLFHRDCERHQELKDHYFSYLVDNFDKVKETPGWKQAMTYEDGILASVVRYRMGLFYEISKRLKQL